MRGLNLSKFKKFGSDDDTTTLVHADGHKIIVAHKALSADMRKNLDKLENVKGYADGGIVESDDALTKKRQRYNQYITGNFDPSFDSSKIMSNVTFGAEGKEPQNFNPDIWNKVENEFSAKQAEAKTAMEAEGMQIQADNEARIKAGLAPLPGAIAPQAAQMPTNFQLPTEQQQQPVPQQASAPNMMEQGLQQQMAGVQKQANAEAALGQQQAAAAQEQQNKVMQLEADYQKNYNALESERNAIMEDIKTNQIDANRYVNSKTSLGKVSSAIGLILGGLGSVANGGRNVALDFLNKQIDNDIDAQKATLAGKQNLLHAIQQQFGNVKDATVMMKSVYADLYASKIAEAAAKSSDPIAKARAEQAIGALKAQYAPALAEIARKQTAINGVRSGAMPLSQAASIIVPEKDRDNVMKEVSMLENLNSAKKNISDIMDKTTALQSVGSRVSSPIQSKEQIEALNVGIFAALKPVFGVLSESDKKNVESSMISILDSKQTADIKKKALLNLMERAGASTPYLDSYPELKALKPKGPSGNVRANPNASYGK